jgi:uncharacterized protein YciI
MPCFVVVRDRGPAWDWSRAMRRQADWEAHAQFMDELVETGFILAGGPLGGEDDATRVLHVIFAQDAAAIEAKLNEDVWTAKRLLRTASIEPWTVLLGALADQKHI